LGVALDCSVELLLLALLRLLDGLAVLSDVVAPLVSALFRASTSESQELVSLDGSCNERLLRETDQWEFFRRELLRRRQSQRGRRRIFAARIEVNVVGARG
jgi:hypothetical protein